jgi:O-acetyl-ADP-ribose deacetylase (regulator of RNase III)
LSFALLFLQADVLAYSALPNLNDCDTTSGEALKHVGGTTYTEVCKPHTNISHGDVVCTTGGNLACQYVLHAVGCDVKGKERNKKVCSNSLIRALSNNAGQKQFEHKKHFTFR